MQHWVCDVDLALVPARAPPVEVPQDINRTSNVAIRPRATSARLHPAILGWLHQHHRVARTVGNEEVRLAVICSNHVIITKSYRLCMRHSGILCAPMARTCVLRFALRHVYTEKETSSWSQWRSLLGVVTYILRHFIIDAIFLIHGIHPINFSSEENDVRRLMSAKQIRCRTRVPSHGWYNPYWVETFHSKTTTLHKGVFYSNVRSSSKRRNSL